MKSIGIALFCCLFGLWGCHGHQQPAATSSDNTIDLTIEGSRWLHPAPGAFNVLKARENKSSIEFHEVVAHEALAAVYELDQVAIKEITPELAKSYTGDAFEGSAKKKLFLVRADFHPSGTGDYEVLEQNNQLLVSYNCLGHTINPQKSALVVALDTRPDDVFVEIHMAE